MKYVVIGHTPASSFVGCAVLSEHASQEDARIAANELQAKTGGMSYAGFAFDGETEEVRSSKYMRDKSNVG